MPSLFESTSHADCVESQQTPRVLIVDDNSELLTVIDEILTQKGLEAVPACSAEHALEMLTTIPIDIIICDVMMPGKDGFALFQEVRRNPDWSEVPFIFLTSLAGSEEIYSGKGCGCDDYLTKPFDPAELVAVIHGKLSLAAQRKRLAKRNFENYRRRIIHTLSHEFRTPLVSINTGTELLLDADLNMKQENVTRLLESIQRGGLRLERLVNDFMLMQQIDLGHAATSCERFRRKQSFQFLVDTAIESFKEGYPTSESPKNLVYTSTAQTPADSQIDVYDVQVAHVIQHLLSNAVKFGGSAEPVEISLALCEGEAVLTVRDHGPGMDRKSAERACELFNQLNREVLEQQGAGLGLTISRYFAEINCGKLRFVPPTDGHGLIAQLSFPLAD